MVKSRVFNSAKVKHVCFSLQEIFVPNMGISEEFECHFRLHSTAIMNICKYFGLDWENDGVVPYYGLRAVHSRMKSSEAKMLIEYLAHPEKEVHFPFIHPSIQWDNGGKFDGSVSKVGNIIRVPCHAYPKDIKEALKIMFGFEELNYCESRYSRWVTYC